MYEGFYGLHERPFDITPNTRFLYLTPTHREALSTLKYGLSRNQGITLLLGEAGTGKTTLIRAALQTLDQQDLCYVYLNNPTLTRTEFYEYLSTAYGLGPEASLSKSRFLFDLQRQVRERHLAGALTSLIIDEAQSLPDALLEEIRLLANMETPTAKLLPVILVGQPELAGRLNQPQLRQLKQRIALRHTLQPLSLRETAAYIAGRIVIAGGNAAEVFTREAVMAVHEYSAGIPRTISVICDNALLSGFALEAKPIGDAIVREVCRDFDLKPAAAPDVPPARPLSNVGPPAAPTFIQIPDPEERREARDTVQHGVLGAPGAPHAPAEPEPAYQPAQVAGGSVEPVASRSLFSLFGRKRRFFS